MTLYYNREGREIPPATFYYLFTNRGYAHIDKDEVGKYAISTIWLGMNHNFDDGRPPLIFETAVFDTAEEEDGVYPMVYCERYATELEARAGHALVKGLFALKSEEEEHE